MWTNKNELFFFQSNGNMEDEYYDEGGSDGEEIAEYEGDEELEGYEGEGDEGEGEFRAEFGAFDRAGHLRVFAETEEDHFFNNMELYGYRNGVPKNMDEIRREFSVLARNYPHPRCLNPGACYVMSDFRNRATGSYEWDLTKYNEQKFRGITKYTLIRYIALFNKYNR